MSSTSVTFILTSLNFTEAEDTLALKENCVSHINPLILIKDKVIYNKHITPNFKSAIFIISKLYYKIKYNFKND
jgi:hypothetical protein